MKKIFMLSIFILGLAQQANAKFINEVTGDELHAVVKKGAVCVAKKEKDGSLELITKSAIMKPEFRKSMRSATYMKRTLTFLPVLAVSSIIVTLNPALAIVAPAVTSLVDGAVTSTYDDGSHFAYNFITLCIIPGFGLGERVMRGVRTDNLLAKNQKHQINEARFGKVLDIIPTLSFTQISCELSDFIKS